MKIDRRQRRAIGIIAVCAGALLVDRVVLGSSVLSSGPASAHASETGSGLDLALLADQAAFMDQLQLQSSRASDLNDRIGSALASVTDSMNDIPSPDGFSMPYAWKPVAYVTSENEQTDDANAFIARHHLTAVLEASGHPYAVINGEPVRMGQQVNGATLLDVDGRSAHFALEDRVITLYLDPIP